MPPRMLTRMPPARPVRHGTAGIGIDGWMDGWVDGAFTPTATREATFAVANLKFLNSKA